MEYLSSFLLCRRSVQVCGVSFLRLDKPNYTLLKHTWRTPRYFPPCPRSTTGPGTPESQLEVIAQAICATRIKGLTFAIVVPGGYGSVCKSYWT